MLIPCAECRRHVRASDPACPFCGAAVEAAPPRTSLVGRFSRAAVFAGLASCTPKTPPQDVHQQQQQPPPNETYVEDRAYAKPPSGEETGTVRGIVRSHTGHPTPGMRLQIEGVFKTSDANGAYEFTGLAPGRHQLIYESGHDRRQGEQFTWIEIKPGMITNRDLALSPPEPPDTGPCCKPYGAPPARKRIV